eukprot:6201125-Pleurochrysis_carterae.AAC.3
MLIARAWLLWSQLPIHARGKAALPIRLRLRTDALDALAASRRAAAPTPSLSPCPVQLEVPR